MTKIAGMHNFPFELVPVCAFTMTLANRIAFGDTPDGMQVAGFLNPGKVTGPRISGEILGGAADWARTRPDGILEPELRLAIRTDDGAMIRVSYVGVVDMGADAHGKMKRREPLGQIFHPRTVLRMQTSSPDYEWVNRRQFIGIGLLDYGQGGGSINYDIYELAVPAAGGQ
jgi:hypothetical protein